MPSDTPSALSNKCKFPLVSRQHGFDMATVYVGEMGHKTKFVIHRALLAQASDYFDKALNANSLESHGIINLPRHRADVFELVYQWLYTGQKLDEDDLPLLGLPKVEDAPSEDSVRRFWYRLFKLADETMIEELKVHAGENFRDSFFFSMASAKLVSEVWDTDYPYFIFKDYLVHVAAYRTCKTRMIYSTSALQDSWKEHGDYCKQILDRMAVLLGLEKKRRLDPRIDPSWSTETLFGSTKNVALA